MMNKVQTLTMRYLLIDSNWGNFDFDWYRYTITMGGGPLDDTSPITKLFTGMPTVNMTGRVSIFACLTGFDVTTASSTT
jgi:hypothetical protein